MLKWMLIIYNEWIWIGVDDGININDRMKENMKWLNELNQLNDENY